jgi:cysteine desulfuration protein SufE
MLPSTLAKAGNQPLRNSPPRNLPLSESQPTTISELIDTFDALGDWESQCDYLIDLGSELPDLPPAARTEANRVRGCQSNVWLVADVKPTAPPVIEITADSDSMIVRGLIAVLLIAYSGRTPQQILETDIRQLFARLGLNRQLSSARRNGLEGMVKRIKAIAEEAAGQQAQAT